MKNHSISIIGAGNMGASLLGGLIATGVPADRIWITDPDTKKLAVLNQQFGVHTTADNTLAIQSAEVIILAVKPQIMAAVTQPIASMLQSTRPLIISIAAGVREENLLHWLGKNLAIVRCMPNTPALIRCGAAAMHANAHVSAEQRTLAESIMRAVGIVVWVDEEKQLDAVTALSGSGPAYFFLLIETLQEIGQELGLPAETAKLLSLQTALGAARMAIETGEPAAELRHKVTSPGGTTEAALQVLKEGNFRKLFTQALQAATKRSIELSQ